MSYLIRPAKSLMATTFVFQHDGALEGVVGELGAEVDVGQVLLAVQGGAHAFGAERDHGIVALVHHDVQLFVDHKSVVLIEGWHEMRRDEG